MRVDDTTPTPFTVTREDDGLTADCGTGPRFFYTDQQTDESLARIRDGVQAVLDFRAQERRAESAVPTEPTEPRPFQVGDVVRISDDATFSDPSDGRALSCQGRGRTGTITCGPDRDGDCVIDHDKDAHHSFLTLVTPAAKS